MTDLIATAAGDPELKTRTWVLLTEAARGGWGLWGHAEERGTRERGSRGDTATSPLRPL